MLSPSFTYKNDDGTLTWTTQYTYDKLGRVPDRGPTRDNLPAGTSIKTGFAQDGDYVDDILQVLRTDVNYEYAPDGTSTGQRVTVKQNKTLIIFIWNLLWVRWQRFKR